MSDPITTTIVAIQDLVGTLTPAIAYNPDVPPEVSLVYPFVVCFPASGDVNFQSDGWMTVPVTYYVDFHASRTYLPAEVQKVWEYIFPFARLLRANIQLAGADTELQEATWQFGEVPYAGVTDVGFRFQLSIKYNDS